MINQFFRSRKKYSRFNWRTIFQKNSGGFSSKRICGVLGWIVCIGVLIAAFVLEKEVPDYGELIAVLSTSLLGLDSITGIWSKNINSN